MGMLRCIHGLPSNTMQSVLNAAARFVFRQRRFDHVTPALIDLHWLRVLERVRFKVATMIYRCLHVLAPQYLTAALHRTVEVATPDVGFDLLIVNCLSYRGSGLLLWVTVRFQTWRWVGSPVGRVESGRVESGLVWVFANFGGSG